MCPYQRNASAEGSARPPAAALSCSATMALFCSSWLRCNRAALASAAAGAPPASAPLMSSTPLQPRCSARSSVISTSIFSASVSARGISPACTSQYVAVLYRPSAEAAAPIVRQIVPATSGAPCPPIAIAMLSNFRASFSVIADIRPIVSRINSRPYSGQLRYIRNATRCSCGTARHCSPYSKDSDSK